jgi:site-specific recombinase XerD
MSFIKVSWIASLVSMTGLAILSSTPALIADAPPRTRLRFLEFFAANIRNLNTRRAYARAATDFLDWCAGHGVRDLADIAPMHVAGWVEELGASLSAPTVKLRLAAIRNLFDWLVMGQVVPFNPASSVRGPAHSARTGRTPVLEAEEARALLDTIDVSTEAGLRDRALIGLMIYSFARVGAALSMKHEDLFVQGRRLWLRLHEKGGKRHEMPCHHLLEEYLLAYVETCNLCTPKAPLFRTIARDTKRLSQTPLTQPDAHAMVRRRAHAAGIATRIGNHSFRATGITTYLKNGGTLENAAAMANHSSTRTTQLYDRRRDEITLAEVERVRI